MKKVRAGSGADGPEAVLLACACAATAAAAADDAVPSVGCALGADFALESSRHTSSGGGSDPSQTMHHHDEHHGDHGHHEDHGELQHHHHDPHDHHHPHDPHHHHDEEAELPVLSDEDAAALARLTAMVHEQVRWLLGERVRPPHVKVALGAAAVPVCWLGGGWWRRCCLPS